MKKVLINLLVLLSVILLINGCQPARRPSPNQGNTPGNMGLDNGQNAQQPQQDMGNPTIPYNSDDGAFEGHIDVNDLNSRANRLAEAVREIEEIESAYVVINANNAIVGARMSRDVELNQLLYDRVEGKIRNIDAEIDQIYFTNDSVIVGKIQNISSRLERGEAVTRVTPEIQNLIQNMTIIQ